MSQEMKADSGKTRMALVTVQFSNAIKGVAKVLTFGGLKYGNSTNKSRGWRDVPGAVERYSDAFSRHFDKVAVDIEAFIMDPVAFRGHIKAVDDETGQLEIDHCITNLMFLRYFMYGNNVDLAIKPPTSGPNVKERTDVHTCK